VSWPLNESTPRATACCCVRLAPIDFPHHRGRRVVAPRAAASSRRTARATAAVVLVAIEIQQRAAAALPEQHDEERKGVTHAGPIRHDTAPPFSASAHDRLHPTGLEDLVGQLAVGDRARQDERADPGGEERERAPARGGRIAVEARGHAVDEARETFRERLAHRFRRTGQLGGERRRDATHVAARSMLRTKIASRRRLQPCAAAQVVEPAREEIGARLGEAVRHRFGEERRLVAEVGVETAAGEARLRHQRVDAGAVVAARPEQAGGSLHDTSARAGLVLGGVRHDVRITAAKPRCHGMMGVIFCPSRLWQRACSPWVLVVVLGSASAAAQPTEPVEAEPPPPAELPADPPPAAEPGPPAAAAAVPPVVGATLELATRYEAQGRLASAWTTWRRAAALLEEAGAHERALEATRRAERLDPDVPRLTIVAAETPAGLRVQHDDVDYSAGVLGSALRVDPGAHAVTARAPGRVPWSTTVNVRRGERARVEIPELDVLVAGGGGASALRPAGIVTAGVGAAGLVVGALLMVAASRDVANASADPELCGSFHNCTPEGRELIDKADLEAKGATAAFVVGGVAVAAGFALLLIDGTTEESASAFIGPNGGGFLWHGHF
jgi:hypothetical protein